MSGKVKKTVLLAAIGVLTFLLNKPAVASADGSYQGSGTPNSSASSSAQDEGPSGASDSQSPAPAIRAPIWTDLGRSLPPGWRVNMETQILGVYDSNPMQSPSAPASDIGANYSGMLEVSKVTGHNSFDAVYFPEYTMYRRFDILSSMQHKYHQTLTLNLSRRTTVTWSLNAFHYPAWGGSSIAQSNLGALLMALTGTNNHDLMSSVTNVTTGLGIEHRFTSRSHIDLGVTGSETWFSTSEGSPYASILSIPSSKFWFGGGTLGYTYDINSGRSVGIDVGQSYYLSASQSYHVNYQSAHLRYNQTLGKGWLCHVGIGPGIRETQNVSSAIILGFDLNANIRKVTKHSIFFANVARTYTAGTFRGSLTAWYGSLAAQHEFGQHWKAGVFANYIGSFYPSSAQTYNTTTDSYWISGQGGYRFTRQLTWHANYGYTVYQGNYSGSTQAKKYQVATGFVFSFNDAHER
jgi:hypothetical protein